MPGGLPGHWERVNTPLRQLTRRERRLVGFVGGLIALAAVVLILAAVLSSSTTRPGCIDVTAAGPTGASTLHACGQQARDVCTPAGAPRDAFSLAVRDACRRQHIR